MVGVKPLRDSPLSGKEGDVPTCVSGCQDSARDKEQGMFRVVRDTMCLCTGGTK